MKKNNGLYAVIFTSLLILVFQAGCLSTPDSPAPRLYMPQSLSADQGVGKFNLDPGTIIGVGPVRVPEYLDRPQMVTQAKDGTLNLAQFDRWAEPLSSAIMRLIDEDLALMLVGADIVKFTWNISIPVKYQVTVDVLQMDASLDGNLFLAAQWSIIDLNKKQMIYTKRSEISKPVTPADYFGMRDALSASCAILSTEIAKELSAIAIHKETPKE